VLRASYDAVYASTFGILEVGIHGSGGYSLQSTGASSVIAYLPAYGTPEPLTSDLLDPTSSPAGDFGGDVVALKLNVDFSDSGATTGSSGMRFGDLALCAMPITGLNGSTVRQFLDVVNVALGGGATAYEIWELDSLAASIASAFNAGIASTYAQQHLFNRSCPP
jgi:hypothetical protein